jgi:hypothetical protein
MKRLTATLTMWAAGENKPNQSQFPGKRGLAGGTTGLSEQRRRIPSHSAGRTCPRFPGYAKQSQFSGLLA